MIIRDNLCQFCTKIYVVIPHLNRLNGSDEGSQHTVSMRNKKNYLSVIVRYPSYLELGHVAQSVGHLTRKSGVLGSIPGLATSFRFSFRFFKKGSCQLLAKVCARSTG